MEAEWLNDVTGQALKCGGRTGKFSGGGISLLEELGRVEGERSNRNRRAEISEGFMEN